MTAKGYELGGKYRDDPIGSEKPRGKSSSQRKSSRDGPSWTPSERFLKNKLMNQFRRTGEGPGGNSLAYRDAPVWCVACGKHFHLADSDFCQRCRDGRHVSL